MQKAMENKNIAAYFRNIDLMTGKSIDEFNKMLGDVNAQIKVTGNNISIVYGDNVETTKTTRITEYVKSVISKLKPEQPEKLENKIINLSNPRSTSIDESEKKIEDTTMNTVVYADKYLDSRKKKTFFYVSACFLKEHKSKIVFSIIVGIITAFLFSWFSIVSSIFLVALFGFSSLIVSFLLLLALDKFIECPSVENWFRYCNPSYESKLKLDRNDSQHSQPTLGMSGDTRKQK